MNTDILEGWLDLLDWILSDDKFDKWNSGHIKQYTSFINSYPCVKKNNFFHENIKKTRTLIPSNNKRGFYVVLQGNKSISRDLIRHIRNGIAHGNIRFRKNRQYLEIRDFYANNFKYANKGDISAYIMIPCSFIFDLKKKYFEIDKKI